MLNIFSNKDCVIGISSIPINMLLTLFFPHNCTNTIKKQRISCTKILPGLVV